MDYNQVIDTLLEEQSIVYIINKSEADSTREIIQATGIATIAWLREQIPEQDTLAEIEQTLLELEEFQRYEIDQVELINKKYCYIREKKQNGQKEERINLIV